MVTLFLSRFSKANVERVLASEAVHNPKFLAYIFRNLDTDGDGVITPMEISEAIEGNNSI